MMHGTFIGFEKKSGSFTSKDTGEVINFSNRIIRVISCEGETADNVGYTVAAEKFKRAVIADILHVADTEEAVDEALRSLILKPISYTLSPVNGEYHITYFTPDPKK